MGGKLAMKLIKNGSSGKYLKSDLFNFKKINDLNNFDVFTSYIKGKSPEYESEMNKLLMVLKGNVSLKTDNKRTKMTAGDILLVECGDRFQFHARSGAKLMQLIQPTQKSTENVMELACSRHSIREFLDRPVLKKDIYYILKTGMHAPSGANRQPWKFVVVGDPEIKRNIREAAEKIERDYYKKLQDKDLKTDLETMGLSWKKPFLETAPFLICVFGDPSQPFYKESLWLAAGWMILAAEELGLSTLTYTPSNLKFLSKLLNVNENYEPELIIPIGYPVTTDKALPRKDMYEVVSWY